MSAGLLGALVAAFAYGAATILQAVAVRRLASLPPGTSVAARVRVGWPYAVGLGLDGLGFVASVAALRTLPLFLVESAVASSVAVTALLSVLVLHVRLGLVGVALAAEEGPAAVVGVAATWWLLAGTVVVAGLLVTGLTSVRVMNGWKYESQLVGNDIPRPTRCSGSRSRLATR